MLQLSLMLRFFYRNVLNKPIIMNLILFFLWMNLFCFYRLKFLLDLNVNLILQ